MLWQLLLICIAALGIAGTFVRRLRRWSLVAGCSGLLIAFALVALPHGLLKPTVLLILWPPSIAGLANPSTSWDRILILTFEFGGNFILYGALGH